MRVQNIAQIEANRRKTNHFIMEMVELMPRNLQGPRVSVEHHIIAPSQDSSQTNDEFQPIRTLSLNSEPFTKIIMPEVSPTKGSQTSP